MLLDVRTPEEYEMGHIAGTKNIPQPDVRASREHFIASGKPIILLCESGNRSSEMCGEFLDAGHQCQFMIGGYQKWISEGRPTRGPRGNKDLRARDIMDYPAKNVLLDTPEVEELMRNEGAVFVDVRYSGRLCSS